MLEFEWHSEKERINAEKHEIVLADVKEMFDDFYRIMRYDDIHSGLEDRWQNSSQSRQGFICGVYGT